MAAPFLSPHDLLRRPLVDQRQAVRLLETHLSAGKFTISTPTPGLVQVTHTRTGRELALTWEGKSGEKLLDQVAVWRDFLAMEKTEKRNGC